MKTIQKLTTILFLLIWIVAAFAGENPWLDNFEKAKKESARRNVPILMNFSGSDWCIWCKRLTKEVFSQEEFLKFAEKNLVLFVADFPQYKSLPDEIAKQNSYLNNKYGITGYPSIYLVDSEGKELARTGYMKGGPKVYIQHLQDLLKKARMNSKDKR
jgi:thioredoxin-related protein